MSVRNAFYEEVKSIFDIEPSAIQKVEIPGGKRLIFRLYDGKEIRDSNPDPYILKLAKLASLAQDGFPIGAGVAELPRESILKRLYGLFKVYASEERSFSRFTSDLEGVEQSTLAKMVESMEREKEVNDEYPIYLRGRILSDATNKLGYTLPIEDFSEVPTDDLLDVLALVSDKPPAEIESVFYGKGPRE